MRSPGDVARLAERGARAGAVVLLLLAWWGQHAPPVPTGAAPPVRWDDTATAPLAALARRWVLAHGGALAREPAPGGNASPPPRAITLGAIPGGGGRAVLATLPAAGVAVRWHDGSGAAGTAVQGLVQPGPSALLDVRAVAGPGGVVTLVDAGGALDSVTLRAGEVQGWRLELAQGRVSVRWPAPGRAVVPTVGWARVDTAGARGAPPRVVRVLAHPGWEAKFVAAALEEAGWRVEARWVVSPTATVTLGEPGALDTARHAAVVVLDSAVSEWEAAAVRRYVAAGGGLVLAGDGVRWPASQAAALGAVRPAQGTDWRRGIEGGVRSGAPRQGLDAWRLVPAAGAQVLAHTEDRLPALVARAHGGGRVVAMAYRESWRWRMAGNDDGVEGHRAWWDGVVRLVAVPGSVGHGTSSPYPGDGAPWLDLVARLGPPAARVLPLAQPAAASAPWVSRWVPWIRAAAGRQGGVLYAMAAALLLLEWRARRRRGAP
jgi:hypothetical protein